MYAATGVVAPSKIWPLGRRREQAGCAGLHPKDGATSSPGISFRHLIHVLLQCYIQHNLACKIGIPYTSFLLP